MVYGDTISFGTDFNQNRGLVAEYLLWDIMTQLECPTGNAVLPLPVTEALRIPSAEEIADAREQKDPDGTAYEVQKNEPVERHTADAVEKAHRCADAVDVFRRQVVG